VLSKSLVPTIGGTRWEDVAARKLIKTCCEHCPKIEDIWLEAGWLHVIGVRTLVAEPYLL